MKSVTDKIALFNPPRIAELIGGNAGDAIAIMKALNQAARDQALAWFHQGTMTEPWPLAASSARGEALVDLYTEQLCEGAHVAALKVQGGSEERWATTMNPWHRLLMSHWAAGPKFDQFQFHRDELARWIAAFGLDSEYSFGAEKGGAAEPPAKARPWWQVEYDILDMATTSEAARQSEVFNKNLSGMKANAVDLGRSITADALPAINAFLQNLRDIQKIGGLGTVLGDAAKDVFGFGKMSASPGQDINKLMRERDRLLKDRDFASSKDRPTRGLDAELKEIEKLLEVSRVRQANGVLASADEFSDQISRRFQRALPTLGDVKKPTPKGPSDDPTKTLLGNELKVFERNVQEQMGIVADRNRHLDRLNSQGLISIKDFYGQQRDILNTATSEQMAAYDAQIAALEKYRDASTKKTEKADASGKIAEIEAKRMALAQEAGMKTLEIDERETRAKKDLADSVQDLTVKMMELNGQTVEVAKINFDKANEGLRQLLQTNGDTAGLANLDKLREAAIAQAQLTEATKNFQLIQSELADAERRIAMDREAGSISEMEALTRTGEARRERLKLMQDEIDKILAIKAASELTDEQKDNLRKLTGQVEEIKRSADPLGDKFRSSFENTSGTLFNDLISGSKRAGDAVKDFGKTLLTEFNSIISKELGKELMNSLFGQKGASGGSSGGGWGSLVTGVMSLFGFADGGYTGPGGKHAPAGVVHKGEVVWSQADVGRAGGVGVVEAMRLGRRGYSSGGVVGMPADAGGRGGGVEINIHAPPGSQTEQRSRRDSGGKEIIDVFINQAVDKVAGQLATDSGKIGQAMRTRRAMGM